MPCQSDFDFAPALFSADETNTYFFLDSPFLGAPRASVRLRVRLYLPLLRAHSGRGRRGVVFDGGGGDGGAQDHADGGLISDGLPGRALLRAPVLRVDVVLHAGGVPARRVHDGAVAAAAGRHDGGIGRGPGSPGHAALRQRPLSAGDQLGQRVLPVTGHQEDTAGDKLHRGK